MASARYTPQALPLGKRHGHARSCAECRRLKLKCTRTFPCMNCLKKGCEAICPKGSLTTGKGNRFVLANTQELHEKISLLANRIRDLEDGLSQSHSINSSDIHPLLTEELLQIKRPLERERPNDAPQEDEAEIEETTSSLGSLTISDGGQASFYGSQTNSWYLLQVVMGADGEDSTPSPTLEDPASPSDIPWLSHAFPFSATVGDTAENVRQMVMSKLPPVEVASMLRDIYFRHAAWLYTPINEQDFEVIFRQIYDQSEYYDPPRAANLSICCMVLALGAFLDLDRPQKSSEAMLYYHLGRASMSIESVLEEHSLGSIQALLLITYFMFLAEMTGPRWMLMGIVVKMALSIGLHRDTGKWRVEPEETQKRRALFYELFTYDSWQSLTFGRPPSFFVAHIDNQMPHSTTKDENGEVEMSFSAWKHRFTSQCLSVVHDQAFGTRPLSYKHFQDLHKKVMNWYIPPSLQVPGFGGTKHHSTVTDQPTVQLTMQRYTAFAIKEITIFYMHRGYFAQALRENPSDPIGSRYSHSVLAAYNSATSFVNLIESLFNQLPGLTERMWFLFTHVFSCSLVLGEIAMKPNMVFARSALSHLKAAYNLFARVSDSTKTKDILPILAKLKERAIMALSNTEPQPTNSDPFSAQVVKSEVDDLLGPIGGMTRLIMKGPNTSSSPSPPQHSSPPPISDSPTQYTPARDSFHGSTWQYHTQPNDGSNLMSMEFFDTFSPVVDMGQGGITGGNINTRMMYGQQQPPHLTSDIQQIPSHHHQPVSHDMEHMPSVTHPYYATVLGSTYSQHHMFGEHVPVMHSSIDIQCNPHNPHESWQNFVAQYKP